MIDLAADRRAGLARLIEANGVTRVRPPMLLPANPYFDLAGEEFGARLMLTTGQDGTEYCLRPDFTLPIATAWLTGGKTGAPAAFGYFGPVFRQRPEGPAEFNQAGLELIAQPDADTALDRVFDFARGALSAFAVQDTGLHLGSVAMFEALLAAANMPDVWRPRIRNRFGHPEALARLLDRLADPHGQPDTALPGDRDALVEAVTSQMLEAGLSLTGSRTPEEIADRHLEKRALAAAHVPGETLALLRTYLAISAPLDIALGAVETLTVAAAMDLSGPIENLARHAARLAGEGTFGAISFDAGFSPRLDYYTGIVFEVTGATGKVLASGGQYDRLLQRLGASAPVTASGCSIWVERLEQEVVR